MKSATKKPSTPVKPVVAILFAPFLPVEVELGEDEVGVVEELVQVMLDGMVKLLAKVKSAHWAEKVNSIERRVHDVQRMGKRHEDLPGRGCHRPH